MKKVILSISAMLFVSAVALAQDNNSNVNQVGDWDNSTVTQHGGFNESEVDQIGDRNKSEVYQGVQPSSFYTLNNDAKVTQTGDDNGAFISQSNYHNKATQTQNGDHNKATIWQDQVVGAAVVILGVPLGGALGGHDEATQIQTGDHNTATIDQGTTGNEKPTGAPFDGAQIAAAAGVSVPVSPHSYNDATQTQNGDWNVAYASQGGKENISEQTQTSSFTLGGLLKNVSNHYQYGDKNKAYSTQDGRALTVNTLQIGDKNYANVSQIGTAHDSVNFQQGNNGIINVTQTGL